MTIPKFLRAIGHIDRVYVRCLSPKNTPLPELESRGMTYTSKKDGQVKKSTVDGYIDLQTSEFYHRYGKDYKPFTDGWGYLQKLNKQGYGIYFVVHHGGGSNADITHGTCLFHESDRATFEQQQLEIDRITQELGKPTAVVKTKKSLHGYWASEIIRIDNLATYQRRWLQYSNCDDASLADLSQLMRLPGFDHLSWDSETKDFVRIQCELLQLHEVSYSLEQFDRVLPPLDIDRWCKQSMSELIESDASDTDIRSFAPYLEGFDDTGKWVKAKCPSHNGESSDSLHIDSETGGFICHAGCSSSSVYNVAKAVAVAGGHRIGIDSDDADLKERIKNALDLKNCEAPIMFGNELGRLLNITAKNFNERVEVFSFILIPVLGSRIKSETTLLVNPGSRFVVPPIRWCGVIGSTGTMKTPILSTVTRPLNKAQKEKWEAYNVAREEYEMLAAEYKSKSKDEKKGEEEPQPPKPMQDVYFSDFTMEAIVSSISAYPDDGYLISVDELAGFFGSMDAYKTSSGVDRPKWLEAWNGGSIKSTRKSGSSYVPHSSISILGGIQPGIIEDLVKKDKSKHDGLWSRFTFIRIDHKPTELFTEIDGSLSECLHEIYTRLNDEPPQQHTLDYRAKPLCTAWHNFLQDKIANEGENNPLMVGIYAKMIGITFRNALILHRTYAAISNTVPEQTVPLETIETAIAWTKWEMNQTLLEYHLLGLTDDDDPDAPRLLKFITKFSGEAWWAKHPEGWVNAGDTRKWWSGRIKPSFDVVKEFMAKVVSLGHAIDNAEDIGSKKYKIKIIPENGSHFSHNHPETHTQSHESTVTTVVTNFDDDTSKASHTSSSTPVTTVHISVVTVVKTSHCNSFKFFVTNFDIFGSHSQKAFTATV